MKFARGLLFLVFSLVVPSSVLAQGGATSSISGVVSDAGGGVLPGATVIVTSNATGTKFEAVTNSTGAYTVPALLRGRVHRDLLDCRIQDEGVQRCARSVGDSDDAERRRSTSARCRKPSPSAARVPS